MTMTITIPTWLLWLLGVPLGIAALILMGLGVMLIIALKDFRPMG